MCDGCPFRATAKLFFTLVTFVAALARAQSFYIAADGDDRDVGTDASHPFKTVAPLNAIRALGPGSKILFHAGESFSGPLRLTMTGAASAPCTLGCYGDGQATLVDAPPFDRPIAQLLNSEFVTIEHLRFIGTLGDRYPGPDFVPKNKNHGLAITSTRASGHRLRSVSVHDCVFMNTYTGLWMSNESKRGLDGFEDVTVSDNVFDSVYQFGCFVIGFDALKDGTVDQHRNISVTGNEFSNIRGDPHTPSEAQPLGVTNATGVTISNNFFHDNCGFGGLIAGTPVGGSTALSVSNCRDFHIIDNEVTRTHCVARFDGSAIDADQDSRHGQIARNLTYNNDGPSIQLGSFGKSNTGDIDIDHNLGINDARGCKSDSVQGAIRFWKHTDHTRIFNNTIHVSAVGAVGTPSCISFEVENNAQVSVKNNIFKTTGGIPIIRPNGSRPGEYCATHLDRTIECVANCYDASGSPLVICTDDTMGHYQNITTAAQWRALGMEIVRDQKAGVFGDAGLVVSRRVPPADRRVSVCSSSRGGAFIRPSARFGLRRRRDRKFRKCRRNPASLVGPVTLPP